MKIKKSYWIRIFGILYIAVCPFILQIKKGIIEYDGSAYYYFASDENIKLVITVLTIMFILGYGAYCGINKKISSLLFFIVLNLAFKMVILLSGVFELLFSDLLYNIYFAPISYICEKMDIFVFVFYEVIFITAFVVGLLISKISNKNCSI